MKKKVVIVILNYVNYRETLACVDSVLLQEGSGFEIVIVDNGSENESCREIWKKYGRNKVVHLLRAGKNYGFAKGNNIGIRYAREKLGADFVLLLNSDTELLQRNYIQMLVSRYEDNVAVLGSRIVQRNGFMQEKFYEYVDFPGTLLFYLRMICGYYGLFRLSEKMEQSLKKYKRQEILHGSCFMLTPSFFGEYKMLYSKTFLYSEEVLLYLYCKRAGLWQKKVEDAVVLHKGKCSSKYLYENNGSIKERYLLSSYKYAVWESFKFYLRTVTGRKRGTEKAPVIHVEKRPHQNEQGGN